MRIVFGVMLIGLGIMGVVTGIKRRAAIQALYPLLYVALGIWMLLRPGTFNTAFGLTVVIIAGVALASGVKGRSAKIIVAAAAGAVGGACVTGQLCTPATLVGAYTAAYGGWGLLQMRRTRTPGQILWWGGTAAMGVSFMLESFSHTLPFYLYLPLLIVGCLSMLVGLAMGGWLTPPPDDQHAQPTTDNPQPR